MVDVAGDELTERLCDAFLLDFKQGEQLKRSLGQVEVVQEDLFGVARRILSADARRELLPALAHWGGAVATAIKGLNQGRAPQAVLLAGGGSLAPGVEAALGEALGLAPGRVGRRPVEMQRRFEAVPEGLKQAWAVTPLGIAGAALEKRGLPFAHFQVNGRWVQALNLNQRFSAFDALLASGKERVQFYGRPGLATTYSFNGQPRSARGTLGSSCKLFVNGAPSSLDAPLQSGDSLTFVDAVSGEDGRLSFAEALEREGLGSGVVRLNGDEIPLPVQLGVDGKAVEDLSQAVPDRARLTATTETTLQELMQRQGVDLDGLIARDIAVTLDGEPRILAQRNYRLQVNGREAGLDSPLLPGDEVLFEPGAGFQERVRDLLLSSQRPPEQRDTPASGAWKLRLNGEWAPLDTAERVTMNGRDVSLDEFLIDGADVRVQRCEPCRTVAEALQRLGLSAWAQGGRVRLRLNGREAALDDPLQDGDALDLALADEASRP
jgi:hypothetical protein